MIPATALLFVTLASCMAPSSIYAAPAISIPEYVKCLPNKTVEVRVRRHTPYFPSWGIDSHQVPKGSCAVEDKAVLNALSGNCKTLIPDVTYFGCYILVGTPIPVIAPKWCIANQTMVNALNKRCHEQVLKRKAGK